MKREKKNIKTKYSISAALLALTACVMNTHASAHEIAIANQSSRYTINISTDWDTIPSSVLREKFPQLMLDAGIYPTQQESYFSDKYVLIGFVPTMNCLNDYSPEQISNSIRQTNSQNNFASDTLSLSTDSIVERTDKNYHWTDVYLTIKKDTTLLHSCQSMLATKFGYITLLAYQKSTNESVAADYTDTLLKEGIITVSDDYKYEQPAEGRFSFVHLFLSVCIGAFVFIVITIIPKIRKK